MNNQELKDMIWNREFTNEEIGKSREIVYILRREGFDNVFQVFPDAVGSNIVGYFTHPIRYITKRSISFNDAHRHVTVVAIQKEADYEFNYYIIEIGDRNEVLITDFQEKWLPEIEERSRNKFGYCATPFDCLLYFLINIILDSDQRNTAETVAYVFNDTYFLRATIDEKTKKYRLEPLHGYGIHGYINLMALDDVAQYGCHFMKPVFERIECPFCHHDWMFDDSKIPVGEKYELKCPKCETILIRKRIN